MKFQITGAVVAAALLGGCVIIDADDDSFTADWDSNDNFGTVYGADVSDSTVTFNVTDNGCTDRSFFDVRVFGNDDDFEVGLKRTRQDYCKALNPDGAVVSWSFQELGIPDGAKVRILNSVRR
ncbi:MAG: hypothetical protein AAFQ84_03765 [Pseudomonadota bacterium]